MNGDLFELRAKVSRALIVLLWVHVPMVALIAFVFGNALLPPCLLAAAFAGIATMTWLRMPTGLSTRLVITVAFIAIISVILAVCAGTTWQVDIHMYYFAALAITAAYCDPIVILAGAGVVAVHHLGLNFIAPLLVFPNGATFLRVVLHAAILILEASALLWMSRRIVSLFAVRSDLTASIEAAEKGRQLEAEVASQRDAAERERLANETARAKVQHQQEEAMTALAAGLDQLARGDLTSRLKTAFATQYENLRADFNTTAESLQNVLREIASETGEIGAGSERIAHASDDLSLRTEQQAAGLEETSAALNVITESLKATAAGTTEAARVVTTARGAAESSGTVVAQTIEAMDEIKQSSTKISNIIGLIDEIAFQTNLLALNAGVEAARAGDAGRGFAVVASEVRGLAQRSAEAAREIKSLISASSLQVENGFNLVGKTGMSLKDIIEKITAMDTLVRQISTSSQEQARSLSEINTAVRQMDQAVQQNATMAEQSKSSAHALKSDTEGLSALVGRFKLEDDIPRRRSGPNMARAA